MGEDPSTIREDIEQTRERMGDTVDALAYKTDVKTRAKDTVTGKVDAVKEKVTGAPGCHRRNPQRRRRQAGATRKAAGVAKENPLGLAISAVAVGFIAGMLVPDQRREREDRPGRRPGQGPGQRGRGTAVDHGKDAAQAAAEAVKETGQEHAEEAKSDSSSTLSRPRSRSARPEARWRGPTVPRPTTSWQLTARRVVDRVAARALSNSSSATSATASRRAWSKLRQALPAPGEEPGASLRRTQRAARGWWSRRHRRSVKAIDRFGSHHGAALPRKGCGPDGGRRVMHFCDSGWALHVPRSMQERGAEDQVTAAALPSLYWLSSTPGKSGDALAGVRSRRRSKRCGGRGADHVLP